MANRYWVGGTANWDGTAGTKWATTSGGAGGASVPTSADDVFFSSSSTGTCTISTGNTGAKSINCTGFTGTIAGTAAITVSGSVTLVAGMTYSHTGTMTFNGTGTLTTAGKTFSGVNVSGSGITTTLGDALNTSNRTLTITQGTFNTASFSVSSGIFVSTSTGNARTITLNNSTVTLVNSGTFPIQFDPTNLTFNAGTSTINCSGTTGTIDTFGGGLTFYNVGFTSTSIGDAVGIRDSNTFNNLSITGRTTSGIGVFYTDSNQTINGTFTVSAGTNASCRIFVRNDYGASTPIGTVRTLTCANVSLTDADFRDITIAGSAVPATGTRLGDCGGNTGITFTAPKTVYWNLAAGGNWSSTAWATSSGGSPATANFPLAQDTAIIEDTGLNASTTITLNASYNIGTVDMSARTSAMTFSNGAVPACYGNFSYGSGVTPSGTNTLLFSNRSTKTINSAGKTFTTPIQLEAPGGGLQLVTNNLTLNAARTFTLTAGTLDLNGNTLSTGIFSSNNSNTRAITFGSANIALTSTTPATTVLLMATATNFSMTTSGGGFTRNQAATATINFGGTSGGTVSNAPNLTVNAGASTLTITGGSELKDVDFTGSTCSVSGSYNACGNLTLASGGTYTSVVPTFIASGTLTSTGKTLGNITVNGSGITVTLGDAANCPTLTLTNGTLNLAGFTFTSTTSAGTAAGTKNLTFNGGTLVCSAATTSAWNNSNPTGFTTTAGTGTGTISMTAATAKTFVGGGSTYNCTLNQGGAGTLTITGANTFNNITNTNATASQITFPASTTTTVSSFTLSGSAGNLVSLRSSTPATQFTLSDASGTVSVSYLDIQDSNATGGALWSAYLGNGNVNSGNNTGWVFTAGNFLLFFTS